MLNYINIASVVFYILYMHVHVYVYELHLNHIIIYYFIRCMIDIRIDLKANAFQHLNANA